MEQTGPLYRNRRRRPKSQGWVTRREDAEKTNEVRGKSTKSQRCEFENRNRTVDQALWDKALWDKKKKKRAFWSPQHFHIE